MALNASQNWFLRPSGLETNGGGFDIGATAGMLTDLACDTNTGNTTSPVVSSASYNFVAGDVGHWVYIAAGTNWRPGFYQIVSVASNKATLSAAVGAAYVPYFSTPSVALGCASVATPTGGTFSINYSDSDSPLLSLTDLTSTASTTVTSSAALFTKAMIGNIIRLASATGSPVADSAGSRYLCITTYTNTSTVVMDKVSGTYTLGVAKMGGAHAQMKNYMTGGVGASPALTSPLAAGHQINVRGSGGNNPSSADYTAQDDYYTFPAGSVAAGQIFVVGYNGRPSYSSAKILTFHVVDGWTFKHLKFQITTTSISYTGYGVVGGNSSGGVAVRGPDFEDCYFDQFGADTACVSRSNGNNDCGSLINCLFDNTGSTTAGTYATASFTTSYGAKILGTIFRKQRGWALEIWIAVDIQHSIFDSCKATVKGAVRINNTQALYGTRVTNCTFYNNAGDDIEVVTTSDLLGLRVYNNIFANTGRYAINPSGGGTQALNDRRNPLLADYNNYWNQTTAPRNAWTGGVHDMAVDPQFVDPANGDFRIQNTALKAVGFPGTFPGSLSMGYLDIGAVQRIEPPQANFIARPKTNAFTLGWAAEGSN